MRARRAILAAGGAAALALGCALVLPEQPNPSPEEGEWPAVRDRFTRSRKIYDRFDHIASATATYQAWEVRAARTDRLARWKRMTEEERQALLAVERAQADECEEFLVAFFTAAFEENDLVSPRRVWRVALVVPGAGELLPVQATELRKDANLVALYPYVGSFDGLYRLRFPRWTGPQPLSQIPFSLVIASGSGAIELRFNEAHGKPAG